MNEIQVRFGNTIRRIRNKKEISQEDLADLCSLHRTYISDVELGKRNVSLENIEKIATALGLKISEVFMEVEKDACI